MERNAAKYVASEGRLAVCVRNCCGVVKCVPLYEHIFRLAEYSLPTDFQTVSDKLRYYRIKCGLFQKNMAELLKIDRSTYARYESGTLTSYPINAIQKCAEIFGIGADKLLDEYNRFIFEGQGEQVKVKRLEFGLTQGEFGKLFGVSKNTVRRWENDSIKMSRKLWERIFKSGIG